MAPWTARLIIIVLVSQLLVTRAAHAQGFPFSQRGSLHQTVAFTDITVKYSRPVARGRMLFGETGVVRWNAIWHPGADSATRISLSRDVLLEGHPLPAGTYSLWLIPREAADWTVILSRAAHVLHAPYPGKSHDVLRIAVSAERGAHMETLAYYFPVVLRDEAVLRLHWGETVLPLRIKAPYRPSLPAPSPTPTQD